MRSQEFNELYNQIMDELVKGMQERRPDPDNYYENLNWLRNSLIVQMIHVDEDKTFTGSQVSELMRLPGRVMLRVTDSKKEHV